MQTLCDWRNREAGLTHFPGQGVKDAFRGCYASCFGVVGFVQGSGR